MEVSEEGKEIFVVNSSATVPEPTKDKCIWNVATSKRLIQLYGKYRGKVGTSEIRHLKKMWVIISEDMTKEFNMAITPGHVENRWRVLERNYKRYLENKNSFGHAWTFFEFTQDMEKLPKWIFFGHKRNLNSNLYLGAVDVQVPKMQCSVIYSDDEVNDQRQSMYKEKREDAGPNKMKQTLLHKVRVMERMRLDRFNYQREKLKILERLGNDRNKLIKERNEILKERNEILKNCKCSCMREKV